MALKSNMDKTPEMTRKTCANCKHAKTAGKSLICGSQDNRLYNATVGKNVWCGKWEEKGQ